jgi:Flp pilus assembly protein TadG
VTRRLSALLNRFRRSTRGAILVETIVVVPIVTIFAMGVVEFGNIFLQRQQMQAGVRDAARYITRCTPDTSVSFCTLDKARLIAFYGTLTPASTGCTSTALRVRGWCTAAQLEFSPAVIDPLDPPEEIEVTGSIEYTGSPVFRFLRIDPIPFSYTMEARYIGW